MRKWVVTLRLGKLNADPGRRAASRVDFGVVCGLVQRLRGLDFAD